MNVTAQIINAEPDPKLGGRYIISVRFDDGSKEGSWIQAFSILTPEAPITPEQLLAMIREKGIKRPEDPLHYIKKSIDAGETFPVEMDNQI